MAPSQAAGRWADVWQRGWEALDVEAVVALYHADCTFSSHPFRVPHRGRDGVRAYVSGAFGEERDVRAWFGTPVIDGDRASVEWWAALIENEEETTLAGTSSLRFDTQGLVIEQRDTWNSLPRRTEPPKGWGR